jgi:hypothetical protein
MCFPQLSGNFLQIYPGHSSVPPKCTIQTNMVFLLHEASLWATPPHFASLLGGVG